MKNNIYQRVFTSIFAGLMAFATIFYLVNVARAISNYNAVSGYIPESYRTFLDSMKTIGVLEIVFSVAVMLMGLITIVIAVNKEIEKKISMNCALVTLFIIALEKIVTIISSFVTLREYISEVYMPGESIAQIVFISFAMLFILIAQVFNANEKYGGGCGFGVGAILFLFITFIISIVSSGSESDALVIVYVIFMFIALVVGVITCFCLIVNLDTPSIEEEDDEEEFEEEVQEVKKVEEPKKVVAPTPVITKKDTPLFCHAAGEALMELKKLLDAGLITEEEYQEKRKKYVDQL